MHFKTDMAAVWAATKDWAKLVLDQQVADVKENPLPYVIAAAFFAAGIFVAVVF